VPDVDRILKIVHIITRLILGGAQENTLITCEQLAKRGHDVTLITGPALGPEGELLEQTKNQEYKTIVIDSLRRAVNPVYDIPAYYRIKKCLDKIVPDIVHTHSAKAGILGRLAASAIRKKNSTGLPKIVHTIHGLAFHDYQNCLLNNLYIMVEKFVAGHTDAFISVADAMTAKALAAGIGKAAQFTTAYSAINENEFAEPIPQQRRNDFRHKYNIDDDTVVLVSIARLFHLKGHKYIIESAKELASHFKNCIWLFVGDGILKEKFQKQIAQAGLFDRFKFTGLLPTSQIPLVIQSSDILVHCSLREGLARVLPQAMLCGKAVISFNIDGAKEVINENTGRLIEPENIEQLTRACAELIKDEQLRIQLGQTGREFIKGNFAPTVMAEKIEKVYNQIVNDHG
jgi:glycosyltransferase involved in cell wall biosynthesis